MPNPLLSEDDPAPFCVYNPDGSSAFLFVSEHAGNLIPRKLKNLGIAAPDLDDHIALDLHIEAVGKALSKRMDACYIYQPYSRLVIDCNRPPSAPQSILKVADNRTVPGNQNLGAEAVQARKDEVFWPFHKKIAAELDRRTAIDGTLIFVTLHSFTPAMQTCDEARPWPITFQYGRQPRFSKLLMEGLAGTDPDITVGDNVPYPVKKDTHYGIPVHGEQRNLLHTMIELRHDCISDATGRAYWVDKLARLLGDTARSL